MRTGMKTITRAFCAIETAILVAGTLLIASVCGDEKPTTQSVPLAATSPEASRETATVPSWDGSRQLQLQLRFKNTSWKAILEKFAEETGLILEMAASPPGIVPVLDGKRFTANQFLDMLNEHLFVLSFLAIRNDTVLIVVHVSNLTIGSPIPSALVPQISVNELSNRARFDIVRIAVPIQDSDPSDAENRIRTLLGPQGVVTRLGRQLFVQDFAENLKHVVDAGENANAERAIPDPGWARKEKPTGERAVSLVDSAGNPIEVGDFDGDGVLDARVKPSDLTGFSTGEMRGYTKFPTPNAEIGSILDALKRRSTDTERETARLAGEYRQAGERLGERDTHVAELQSRLKALVQTAFDHRQQAQRLEAEILRHKLKQVDARLAERERLKEKITERRVQELLDPKLKWNDEQGALRPPPARDLAQDGYSRSDKEVKRDATEIAFAGEKREQAPTTSVTKKARTPYPRIVKTVPEAGATEVDPRLKEITVTFDRDMRGGMSWTGGPPWFPETDPKQKARWTNPRTCVLPVVLTERQYYRVGINSTSFQNFKSADGTPTPPSAIWFTTRDASDEVKERVRQPEIASIEPANGATDVDPAKAELRVTFTTPMGDGMSWTGSGPKYPPSPSGSKATWSEDGLTCTLSVTLAPGHDYELGLNSLNHINFQSRWGVPLEPVIYRFKTR